MSNKTVSKLKQKYATRNTNVQKIVRADARGVQTYQGQKSGPPLFGGPLQINFPRSEFLPQSGPAYVAQLAPIIHNTLLSAPPQLSQHNACRWESSPLTIMIMGNPPLLNTFFLARAAHLLFIKFSHADALNFSVENNSIHDRRVVKSR